MPIFCLGQPKIVQCVQGLKLQSVRFASLSPSLFETCNCSYLRNYHLQVGCASARLLGANESNVLRSMCGCQSTHSCGYSLYFGITDFMSWKYDPIKNVNVNNISIAWLCVFSVCISIPCRLLVTMDESSVVTDDCRIDLSGLQPAIKTISVIIPAAMRKGMILPHIW